ncbi:glycogen debranching protein [Turneriella parva]|uniref:Glycogen debranching enzyme GlgX n=1 Tax=Turneriella parva (strain ATCC BAA-1111 / DSM 21527 / NCTC 11395 / H) TaxID=869212 RepID=I4B273_TURPD|nr:alpha-amylase family glycosyl hydrolase [Turneriella parva]AFM11380.1 glycogen debranching enzyme GlgX [Turneriella parva DSM 21527]
MTTQPGNASPLGPSAHGNGYNFAVYVDGATQVNLCLYSRSGELLHTLPMQRSESVWHLTIIGGAPDLIYCFEVERAEIKQQLCDPFAKNLNLLAEWRKRKAWPAPVAAPANAVFDWSDDRRPMIALPDMVIYEAHVKGLTIELPGIPEAERGRYRGAAHAAVISHLKRLGVTTLELLPVHAKTEDAFLLAKGLTNYWGYNTLNYFSPESEYATDDAVTEFKTMVKALHAAGIEVILDVVYNHTGEGPQSAPAVSYRGLADSTYYTTDENGAYLDYTHCGNSLNTDETLVRLLIHESLRYWADEMHVDGFRFDLAPTLFRKRDIVTFDHELHHMIVNDPVLSSLKLIVEPWDLGPDGYQRGRFPQPYLEWNDVFRDASRQFWKGERPAAELAALMVHRGRPVINFVTCHDGFTLLDLVSYEQKRNVANGEDNRDGSNHNHSFNCGIEGETPDVQIRARRKKLRKNLLATLIFSQDIPMLLAGDEMGNTQFGNNNAYCQDNEISWLKWANREEDMIEFVAECLRLRRQLHKATHPAVIEAPANAARAFGIWFDRYCLLMNSASENVLFSVPGSAMREVLHTGRQIHHETVSDIYLLTAQSVVLLLRNEN